MCFQRKYAAKSICICIIYIVEWCGQTGAEYTGCDFTAATTEIDQRRPVDACLELIIKPYLYDLGLDNDLTIDRCLQCFQVVVDIQ